jgi:hypothetical protein
VIPAVLRRRCGLRAGDLVLLAAVPGEDALAAYPFAVEDEGPPSRTPKGAPMSTAVTPASCGLVLQQRPVMSLGVAA